MLFSKRTIWLGALLSVGLMAGALFSHLTQLGIEVKNDGGTLYGFSDLDPRSCRFMGRAKHPLY